jgi:hypothetical protein
VLDIWPELPIVIDGRAMKRAHSAATNIVSALKHHDRVRQVFVEPISHSLLEVFSETMQAPFPLLTDLHLSSYDENHGTPPFLSDSFSAPSLQHLYLDGISFPGLPNLLSSVHNLVTLTLRNTPLYGYISPESMVTSLSALTRLEEFCLLFRLLRSRPNQEVRHPPPLTPIVLPALTKLDIKCNSEYLEDIVSRIDTPLLNKAEIVFFDQPVFDTHLLCHFIGRTEAFKAPRRAEISFFTSGVAIALFQQQRMNYHIDHKALQLGISCDSLHLQLLSVVQVFTSLFPPLLPTLERLEIHQRGQYSLENSYTEHTQWWELLLPFTSVKDLALSEEVVPHIALVLLFPFGASATAVLPALRNLLLQSPQPVGYVQNAIHCFIVARQLSGHPVTVYYWDRQGRKYVRWEAEDH